MQVTLKQNDIEKALKQYIESRGINLAGQEVKMAFTAGRKEGGMTVDVTIEEGDVRGTAEVPKRPTRASLTPLTKDTPSGAENAAAGASPIGDVPGVAGLDTNLGVDGVGGTGGQVASAPATPADGNIFGDKN